MRIAILAPLWKTVPPQKYGGTELVASLLADSLVDLGHDVTLYACAGSNTKAKLIEVTDRPLYDIIGEFRFDAMQFYDLVEVRMAFEAAKNGAYDIIHNHMNMHVAAFDIFCPVPMVTTNHSSVPPDFEPLAKLAKNSNYISISNSQREMAPYLNYIETIYHGIDTNKFDFNSDPQDYLLFLATMSEAKGVDRAIEIAKRSGKKMIMAGDIRDKDYFETQVKPHIDAEKIVYIGEVDPIQKNELMRNAKAYVFPIRWSEAFGLTVAESLAAGTPVIAYQNGSLPEIIEDGKTGFLVNSVDKALDAINKIDTISREYCHQQALDRFSAAKMAKNHELLYGRLIKG
jgi:glycosyltransferase involved in cell wall biosynthesis